MQGAHLRPSENPVKFLRAVEAGEYDKCLAEEFEHLSLEELRQLAVIVGLAGARALHYI